MLKAEVYNSLYLKVHFKKFILTPKTSSISVKWNTLKETGRKAQKKRQGVFKWCELNFFGLFEKWNKVPRKEV